jgi:hypothetical protein
MSIGKTTERAPPAILVRGLLSSICGQDSGKGLIDRRYSVVSRTGSTTAFLPWEQRPAWFVDVVIEVDSLNPVVLRIGASSQLKAKRRDKESTVI